MVYKDLKSISSFIINNSRLEKLKLHINEFNPLKVLKLNHYEIRHSNVLGWLFDPDENHNLGDSFFKKVVLDVLAHDENTEKTTQLDFTETNIFLESFHDLEVIREYPLQKKNLNKKYIDILMVSHVNKLVIIIENKIYAGEGEGQLQHYYHYIAEQYEGYNILPIYLTLYGDTPSQKNYFIYSHLNLYRLLDNILPTKKELMSEKVYNFVNDYLLILRELTIVESANTEQCEELYREYSETINLITSYDVKQLDLTQKEHKQLYDLIRRYKEVSQYIKEHGEVDYFKQAFYQFIEQTENLTFHEDCHTYGNSRAVFFYPQEYLDIQNYQNLTHPRWPYSNYPCPFIFDKFNDCLSLKIEVGDLKDEYFEKRMNFINYLRKNTEYSINRGGRKTNQIISRTIGMDSEAWRNPDIILENMKNLYLQFREDEEAITYHIKQFWREAGN